MNGCGNWSGYLVLVTFMVLFSLIMLNLLVAVIIQGFEKTMKDESSLVKDVEQFTAVWSEFDKKATLFIAPQKLSQLLLLVDPPIGWHGRMMPISKQRIELMRMEIPLYEKGYYYYDVLKYMVEEYLLREEKVEEPKL